MSNDERTTLRWYYPNRVKLRGWEFETVVPWGDLFEGIDDA